MCKDRKTVKQALDRFIGPAFGDRMHTGLVVGVITHGESHICCYGTISHPSTDVIAGSTLFEIGSVTKVFTSTLLVSTTQEGLMGLDDRLCDLLPEVEVFPSDITLRQLATHTSGLPRLPSNFTRSFLNNPQDPYAAYTSADLLAYLAKYREKQRRPSETPRTFKYSNLGFGLLGHIVAQKLGTSYEAAVVKRICGPIGMRDTCVRLSSEQSARLAAAHTPSGKPTLHWQLPTLAGAGALRSTACDMLKFLAANLGDVQGSLKKVFEACREKQVEIPRLRGVASLSARWRRSGLTNFIPPAYMTLGWLVSLVEPDKRAVYWHNGATGGHCAFVGFAHESRTGVVVLSNRAQSQYALRVRVPPVEEIGFYLLRLLS
jgi:serine-type D-Ala-D-Ala carboxypeptidase/endopeptidase